MAIMQVIEYMDPTGREIVRRVPERGSGEFRLGSQLVVREYQSAVFFRDGKALDTLGPGRHTLSTMNIPLLINLISLPFGQSPFRAEVYFVNLRQFVDQKWGTPEPVALRDPELGLVRLRAFGTYAMEVADPQLFVNKIVGGLGYYETQQIESYLRGIIIAKLIDLLGELRKGLFDLPALFEELAAGVRAKVSDDFAGLGVMLKALYVNSISPTEETARAIDERASMGAIGNMQAYMQFKAARALGDAALAGGDAGTLAGAGVGLGAGLGLGAAMAGAIGQAMQGGQAQAGTACPSCKAANPAGARFCNSCGASMSGNKTCPGCKAENPAGARFCGGCGAKLDS
jgi:membrane protease subunit (stomatin/prohibitin family)